jgi:Domain of unknown function (DUF4192)
MAATVAAIPALVRRIPADGDVVLVFLDGPSVVCAAIGTPAAFVTLNMEMYLDHTGATNVLGVTFGIEETEVRTLASMVEADEWLRVDGKRVHRVNSGESEVIDDWRESPVTAELVAEGGDVASGRDELIAEAEHVDEPPTQADAELFAIVSNYTTRDLMLASMAEMDDSELHAVIAIVVQAAKRYPDAALCTVAACGYYMAGDGTRANVWLDRALEIDSEYGLALLMDQAIGQAVSPGTIEEAFAAAAAEIGREN